MIIIITIDNYCYYYYYYYYYALLLLLIILLILLPQAEDGWLGPDTDRTDFWSRYPLVLALVQYHEALPESPVRKDLLAAMLRFFQAVEGRLAGGVSLKDWSAARAHDLIWAIHYCVEQAPAEADRLLALAARLHREGFDWNGAWFNSTAFPRHSVESGFDMWTHGVNNAQAVKRGAVWARQGGDAARGVAESLLAWETLMAHHGQPNGIFSADEHLAGRMPSRGTELCMVVESMWSLALVAQATPTDSQAAKALDALELLAFNALPGSLSDDLWSHPYLQFANSFQATGGRADHVWPGGADGPDAAMYGLSPNYECCTANFHQGYPKLINHLFFKSAEEKLLVSAIWAPCNFSVPDVGGGLDLELQTEYPFGLKARYLIRNPEAFTLQIRLPAFLRESIGPGAGFASVTVLVEGHEQAVMLKDDFISYDIPAWPLPEPRVAVEIRWAAAPRVQRSDSAEQGASVFAGPLLLSLDLAEQWREVRKHAFSSSDWSVVAGRPWRYALAKEIVAFQPPARRTPGLRPYRHSAAECPLAVNATLVVLPPQTWPASHGSPGPLPGLDKAADLEVRTLVPYGCTAIRIAAFPVADGRAAETIYS